MFWQNPHGPLVPSWITDDQLANVAKQLVAEIDEHFESIEYVVNVGTPTLLDEAEAMLVHVSEGW